MANSADTDDLGAVWSESELMLRHYSPITNSHNRKSWDEIIWYGPNLFYLLMEM